MAPRKDDRLLISSLGEYYEDLLTIDAFVAGNSKPQQGKSLLSAKLNEKEINLKERVAYLAKKRGIEFNEMWATILKGKAEKLMPEEIEGLHSEFSE